MSISPAQGIFLPDLPPIWHLLSHFLPKHHNNIWRGMSNPARLTLKAAQERPYLEEVGKVRPRRDSAPVMVEPSESANRLVGDFDQENNGYYDDLTTKRGFSKNFMEELHFKGKTRRQQLEIEERRDTQSLADNEKNQNIEDIRQSEGQGLLNTLHSKSLDNDIPIETVINLMSEEPPALAPTVPPELPPQENSEQPQNNVKRSSFVSNNSTQNMFKLPVKRQSSESSQLFKLPQNNPKPTKQRSNSSSSQLFKQPPSENLFEVVIQPSKKKKSCSSDSSDDDLFQLDKRVKDQRKASVMRSGLNDKHYTLEHILTVSQLYKHYLVKTERRYIKKISIDVPELRSTVEIPKELYFRAERVAFRKITEDMPNSSSGGGFNYLCFINKDRTRLYFQDLKAEQMQNLNGCKCSQIILPVEAKMSRTAEYDHINHRFYLFSNKQQRVYVYSETSLELLCKLKVQKSIIDPELYFYHTNGRNFLLLVGGHTRVQREVVQGSKYIQIFECHAWQIGLKSRLIKLIIGRISPLVLAVRERGEGRLLVLGGSTVARVTKDGHLHHDHEPDINESTNMTGISIKAQQILELFDYQQNAVCSNLSVKVAYPLKMHDGLVITLSSTFLLILPNSRVLHQLKIVNKQINVIESRNLAVPISDRYQRRQLQLRVQKESIVIYRISEKGFFEILGLPEEQIDKCCCNPF